MTLVVEDELERAQLAARSCRAADELWAGGGASPGKPTREVKEGFAGSALDFDRTGVTYRLAEIAKGYIGKVSGSPR